MASTACDPALHARFVLMLGDTSLVLAQRLAELVGSAPTLEEEMAVANIALDLLGQANMLLEHVGTIDGTGRTADELAFTRDEREYTNLLLAERPNIDFAHVVVRQLLHAAWMHPVWSRLATSSDPQLAGIAQKAVNEAAYHLRWAAGWFVRLADGTEESRSRLDSALEELWPFAGEWMLSTDVDDAVAASGLAPGLEDVEAEWRAVVEQVFGDGGVQVPADMHWQRGGRDGRHTEALGHMLAELQHLPRTHPGASW